MRVYLCLCICLCICMCTPHTAYRVMRAACEAMHANPYVVSHATANSERMHMPTLHNRHRVNAQRTSHYAEYATRNEATRNAHSTLTHNTNNETRITHHASHNIQHITYNT
jgi:hypothetical protein